MAKKNIVVIGASAGGIDALKSLVAELPAGLDASLFVVQHTSADSPGLLPAILEHVGKLPACNASDMQEIETGQIYVASPDHHLLIEQGHLRVTRGPKENRSRPAIDPLFRSAAYVYRPRVVGIVLTGKLDDGTAGLWAIKQRGGTAIVQDPKEALYPSMPQSALAHVEVDHCVKVAEIAPLLVRLIGETVTQERKQAMKDIKIEVDIAAAHEAIEAGVQELGSPSHYACPECHGVLLELKEHCLLRFRCHTGHAYTVKNLLAEADEAVEKALWTAIRALDESARLLRAAGQHLCESEQETATDLFERMAADAKRRSELVRQAFMHRENGAEVEKILGSRVS